MKFDIFALTVSVRYDRIKEHRLFREKMMKVFGETKMICACGA